MLSEILIQAALLVFCHSVLWFIISLIAKRNDVADIGWGLGFCLIALFLMWKYPLHPPGKIMVILIGLWGTRLSLHIGIRNAQKKEDFRYKNWREAWGKTFYWRSFLQVFLLQSFFMYLISAPLYLAAFKSREPYPDNHMILLPAVAGMVLWLSGFMVQAIADYQLSSFKKHKQPGQILQTGLWQYSRHPNYLGEIIMWWGIWLILPAWWTLISPILITYLIAFVSGVPMLEEKYKGNPAFEAYKKRTPALFPRWPK